MMSSEVEGESSPLSRVLFLGDNGEPMCFFLRPGPAKAQFQPIIRAGGGVVCRVQKPGAILLSDPEDMAKVPASEAHHYVSTQYVRDCVERNQQLEVEDYRFRGEGEQTRSPKRKRERSGGRVWYTGEEDAAILCYMRGRAQEVRGNRVWQRMEQEVVTSHSWQSMKDRYRKFLAKQQQEPLEEDGGGREKAGAKDGPLHKLFDKPVREKEPAQSMHERDPPPPSPEKADANRSLERTDPQSSAEPTHPQPSPERPIPRHTFCRHKIIVLHQQGNSQRAIARLTGFSRCGVQAVIKKFEETGQIEDRPRSGRPKKLSASDERYLKVTSLRDRRKSSEVLAQHLEESSGTKVHASTVRRSLTRNGLVGRVAAKKAVFHNKGGHTKH